MPRVYLGNFEFEHSLAGTVGATLPQHLRRLGDELAFAWLAVADDGDAIVAPREIEPGFLDAAANAGLPRVRIIGREELREARSRDPGARWELCPWGWSEAQRALALRCGLDAHSPPAIAVRLVNSRRFSCALETEWRVGLLGAGPITSLPELAERLSGCRPSDRWVIKAEFGMSARERILGQGPHVAEPAANWIRRRLAGDGIVFLEPWVERVDEAGLQFDVPHAGEPRLLGVTPLLTDPSGRYVGSRFDEDRGVANDYAEAIDVARRAACRIRDAGYFGPLGIDAMRYRRPDGTIGIRPLQDINARHTMGRLSLGLRRLLRPGDTGTWHHVRWNDGLPAQVWYDDFVSRLPAGARAVRTAPFEIDGAPTRAGTIAVLHRADKTPFSPASGEKGWG